VPDFPMLVDLKLDEWLNIRLPTGQLVSIAFAWLLPLSKHQAKFTIDADPTVRIKRTGSEPR
jgi:hypothetical protein